MEKIVLEPWMEEILNVYYKDGGKKLHGIIDRLFGKKYGGINNKDMDEFYSVANDVIVDICKHNRYDPSKGEFGGFLYGALDMAIIDEFKRQTRDKRVTKIEIEEKDTIGNIIKRRVSIHDVYMDAPIGEDVAITMKDLLKSDFNLEKELSEEREFSLERSYDDYSPRMQEYLHKRSKVQIKILELLTKGYCKEEVIDLLHIDSDLYRDSIVAITSCENTRKIEKLIWRSKDVR